MSISSQAIARRQPRAEPEKREVAYVVRAKTGPGARDWTSIGVAFERKNGATGFTVKLNTLPINKDWNGVLVFVPPILADEPDEGDE